VGGLAARGRRAEEVLLGQYQIPRAHGDTMANNAPGDGVVRRAAARARPIARS
jgi:hypothetical protein